MKTDVQGNLFFTEATNHLVRKISTDGTISTVAGTGTTGFSGDNGAATSAQLATPWGMTLDDEGNIYISDSYNHRIRKVDTDGNITTIAGARVPECHAAVGKRVPQHFATSSGPRVYPDYAQLQPRIRRDHAGNSD